MADISLEEGSPDVAADDVLGDASDVVLGCDEAVSGTAVVFQTSLHGLFDVGCDSGAGLFAPPVCTTLKKCIHLLKSHQYYIRRQRT